MKQRFLVLVASLAAVALIATPGSAAPFAYPPPIVETFPHNGPPDVSASAWILYDESTDSVLGSLAANERRAMASITKIMTGLLVIENSLPRELVIVSQRAAETGEKEIGLEAGEIIEMDALFKALMIHSANDAATAIAEHISGSVAEFVNLMNSRAAELGLEGTSFANPHGLDAPNHYTTAEDMLTLTREAMRSRRFADVVRSKIVVMPPDPEGMPRKGTTTNLMLYEYEGTLGVKTGFTASALLTYAGVAERGQRRIYVVVLGSEGERGHFADAAKLFDYAFNSLGYYGDIALGSPYVAAKARAEPDPILVARDVESYLHLAGQGLTLTPPAPTSSEPVTAGPAAVEVARHSEPGPTTLGEIATYWLTVLFGS
jgi:serine-type D-Ala-D-Ala carboxypeptidase (penicillin-binding protein 5/6)